MSIASAITAAQQRVANAYTAISGKGGTLPATQNLTNMPAAIESIPSGGGGGGDPIDVKASVGTQSYTQNDKVTLIPSETIYGSEAFSATFSTGNSYNTNRSLNCEQGGYIDFSGLIGVYNRKYNSTANNANFYDYPVYITFNGTASAITSATPTTEAYHVVPIGGNLAIQFYDGNYSYNPFMYSIGSFKNGSFTPMWTSVSTSAKIFYGASVVRVGDCAAGCQGNSISWFVYNKEAGTERHYNGAPVTNGRYCYPTKKDGHYYIIVTNYSTFGNTVLEVPGNSATSYSVANRGYYFWSNHMSALDENGDYYAYRDLETNRSFIFKLDKTNDTWVETTLDQASEVFNECFRETYNYYTDYGRGSIVLQAKDFGTYVDIYIGSQLWGYSDTNKGNKIAHLKFTKSTEKMERLADVFYDVDDLIGCDSLSVNWEQGLIAVIGPINASQHKVYVRKMDSIAEVYPYTALTSNRGNYTTDAIVGFVDENKGTDLMGSTVLSVNTTQDPTRPPFSNVGKIIGMNVIINEGEPT